MRWYSLCMSSRISQSQKDIAKILEIVSVLKDDVSVLKEDVSVLKEDVSVLKADVSVLKEDVSVLKEDMSDMKQEVVLIHGKIDDLTEHVKETIRWNSEQDKRLDRTETHLHLPRMAFTI